MLRVMSDTEIIATPTGKLKALVRALSNSGPSEALSDTLHRIIGELRHRAKCDQATTAIHGLRTLLA